MTFEAVKTMAKAMRELRGLDRHLIIEIEENAGDIVASCAVIEAVLTGFLRLPKDEQNAVLVAGIAPKSELGKLAHAIYKSEKKADEALKAIQKYNATNFDDYSEIDCPHWLE